MAKKMRFEQLEEARQGREKVVREAVSDLVRPYQKEIRDIQRDAKRLQSSLERLSSKIAHDVTGQLRAEGRLVKGLSTKARKNIERTMKKAWARKQGKGR